MVCLIRSTVACSNVAWRLSVTFTYRLDSSFYSFFFTTQALIYYVVRLLKFNDVFELAVESSHSAMGISRRAAA